MSDPHVIRPATVADASELARLISLLGYPPTADALSATWQSWAGPHNWALVAQGSGCLLGAITFHCMVVLHRPQPVGRITSLVVDPASRGRGLGRALVVAAERSLREAGCGLLEVTSHARRAEAHDFYRHLGYEQTSLRFAKVLVPPNTN